MHRRRLWTLCVGVLVGLLAVGVLATRVGYANESQAQCSLATLRGTYLFAANGAQIVDNDPVPLAAAGYEVYDGEGHVRGVVTQSVNGEITRNNRFTGTYAVSEDCTGTITLNTGKHFDQFIAPDGSEFSFISTDPGVAISGFELRATARRVGD